MEYRYMIYNTLKKEFQFPSICETTEKGANTILFKKIGYDSKKWRFEIRKVEKNEAYKMRQEMKDNLKARNIHSQLPNIPYAEIYDLVVRDRLEV